MPECGNYDANLWNDNLLAANMTQAASNFRQLLLSVAIGILRKYWNPTHE
jgi:hypothetical protein